MGIEKIAIPIDYDDGLDSPISGHFGHTQYFLIATLEDDRIVEIRAIPNVPHDSCAGPVNLLAQNAVSVLLTSGMGMNPFMICQQLGISVVRTGDNVAREAIERYLRGESIALDEEGLCQGGGRHQH